MRRAETTATARRIGPLLALDASGNPVLEEDFSGDGELEVSLDGGAFGPTTGTIIEIGQGYYCLEAPEEDAATAKLWIAAKLAGVCEEFVFREDMERSPNGIIAGEADPAERRIGPLLALDEEGEKLDEPALAGVTVEISVNGSPWAAGEGSLAIHDDGYPYYEPTQPEVAARGWICVKISGDCEEFTLREDLVDPLPPEEVVEETPPATAVPVAHDDIPVLDHVALALARLPQQYRGSDDDPTELLTP